MGMSPGISHWKKENSSCQKESCPPKNISSSFNYLPGHLKICVCNLIIMGEWWIEPHLVLDCPDMHIIGSITICFLDMVELSQNVHLPKWIRWCLDWHRVWCHNQWHLMCAAAKFCPKIRVSLVLTHHLWFLHVFCLSSVLIPVPLNLRYSVYFPF